METESVRSEVSSRSRRSSRHRQHTHRSTRSSKSQRKESDNMMAPFQTSVNINPETGRDGQEVIEVQILPQDENWGENTTAVTGNTSEGSQSMEDVSNWPIEADSGLGFVCSRYFSTTIALGLSLVSFVSPLAMVVLPKLGFFPGLTDNLALQPSQRIQLLSCTAECKGILLSLAFKLVLLAIGVWAVFLRPRNAVLPRIFVFRAMMLVILAVCAFSYWLFYFVQITEASKALAVGEEAMDYTSLVSYSSSFSDTLLFIHYAAVVLMEIRHLEPVYYVKVVRSPDGESRSYAIGQLSIQRAAVWVLQKYYTEFPIYNPYLEKIPISKSQRKGQGSIKFYEVDSNTNAPSGQTRSASGSVSGRRNSHNERYYEEAERARRVRKRRARLHSAAEDAFAHVRRVRLTAAGGGALGPREAAQAVFPSLARALQKYLRATRQQPRHSAESVLAHLARCLSQDASPRAFLEPFLVEGPVLSAEQESRTLQRWALVSDDLLARPLADGVEFQLRQGDVSLICTIKSLPRFSLSEEVVDPKSNRFVLRLNSETSV
ncbi:vang-like protein 1 [Danaus plexippus]|uniref:Vang-like protein n=1 Tax=Danaus plexippus plexippus TaxID=278856 RepID=A0A212FD35_DANPL|nr:vang-like protein 1 [Danaus plexippus plexippus]XP_032516407.1 vang-like protein 1 [Danaus plexippus]XP_061378588.1 vang-like protein 1 [Danaus plexippus]OWR51627.1 Strabismus [Danaus plexippus plexippus]